MRCPWKARVGLFVAVRAQGTTIFERLLFLHDDDREGVRRFDQQLVDDGDGERDVPAGGSAVPGAEYHLFAIISG